MKRITLLLGLCAIMASCNNQAKPEGEKKMADSKPLMENKQERNKATAMASMEAAGKGDAAGVVKDAASSFTEYLDGSMPPITNIDSLKGMIGMLLHSIEGYKASNIMLIAEGDYVSAYATWNGVFKNDFMGIKATNKSLQFPDVDIYKFNEEGKIIEHRSVQNIGAILMASATSK